jgi:hypothetical protein
VDANYSYIYIDLDVEDVLEKLSTIDNETTKEKDREKNTNSQKVPTLQEIARRVARLEKKNWTKNNTLHMK